MRWAVLKKPTLVNQDPFDNQDPLLTKTLMVEPSYAISFFKKAPLVNQDPFVNQDPLLTKTFMVEPSYAISCLKKTLLTKTPLITKTPC
jgi:hypothetical protein